MAERFEFKPEATYGGIVVPKRPLEHQPIYEPEFWRMPKIEDYSLPDNKKLIQTILGQKLGIAIELDKPPEQVKMDYAVKLFEPIKRDGAEVVSSIIRGLSYGELQSMGSSEARQDGPYLNIKLDDEMLANEIITEIETLGPSYGEINVGNGRTVVFDTSSPNIAKEMTVAHLRSTVIGESLARIYQNCGYRSIRDNHLGDWGTQFGILGRAYELWGDEVPELQEEGSEIKGLLKLYVRMNQAIEEEGGEDGESDLKQQGLEWFRRLESGDPEALKLWQWALDISLVEASEIYKRLGSNFEYVLGESEYVGMIPSVLNAMQISGLAKQDGMGGMSIDLTGEGKDLLRIQKSDGTSLYATRDLATLAARSVWFTPEKIIYVVGGEQQHYFNQVFKAFELYSKKVGEDAPDTEHVYFGMVKLPEGKMSTRKGNIVFLEEVLDEAVKRAKIAIANHAKESSIEFTPEEIEDIAEKIGVGAVIYSELRQGRTRSIKFDWDEALSFSGNSGPYLQYTNARINALFRRLDGYEIDFEQPLDISSKLEAELAIKLGGFPEALKSALDKNEPSLVAEYLYELGSTFNAFYKQHRILDAETMAAKNTRLRLSQATSTVLSRGLYLLGMPIPEKM